MPELHLLPRRLVDEVAAFAIQDDPVQARRGNLARTHHVLLNIGHLPLHAAASLARLLVANRHLELLAPEVLDRSARHVAHRTGRGSKLVVQTQVLSAHVLLTARVHHQLVALRNGSDLSLLLSRRQGQDPSLRQRFDLHGRNRLGTDLARGSADRARHRTRVASNGTD